MSVWLPALGHVCGVDADQVVHAVNPWSTTRRDRRYKQPKWRRVTPRRWEVACGSQGLTALYTVDAVSEAGEPRGHMGMSWPPPVAELRADGRSRCAECWAATGRKRPHPQWRRVKVREVAA